MSRFRSILAAVAIGMLAGCSVEQVPLPNSIVTEQPSATPAPTQLPTSVPAAVLATPGATTAALPSVAPVPTLAAAEIEPLEIQQRALVALYRRVNQAV